MRFSRRERFLSRFHEPPEFREEGGRLVVGNAVPVVPDANGLQQPRGIAVEFDADVLRVGVEGVPGQFGEGLDGTRCREPFEEIRLHLDVKGVLHVVVGLRWRTTVQQVIPMGICTRDESIGVEWRVVSHIVARVYLSAFLGLSRRSSAALFAARRMCE